MLKDSKKIIEQFGNALIGGDSSKPKQQLIQEELGNGKNNIEQLNFFSIFFNYSFFRFIEDNSCLDNCNSFMDSAGQNFHTVKF